MIENELLLMRPIEEEDLKFLRDLGNDPVVRANVVGWDWPLSLANQKEWFEAGKQSNTTKRFIVESKEYGPIGLTGLWDIDWHNRNALTALKIGVIPDIRGKGYGTSAIHLLMEFAFYDVGLHRLHSSIIADNAASIGAYVRNSGWREEGIFRQHVWRNGEYKDLVAVAILREEYEQFMRDNLQ